MFMNNYVPPFTITNKMLEYIFSVMEKIGKIDNYTNLEKMPNLRRNNKIKSIHASLAIEDGVVELTIPDKPTSKNQMYYKV